MAHLLGGVIEIGEQWRPIVERALRVQGIGRPLHGFLDYAGVLCRPEYSGLTGDIKCGC